MVLLLAQTDRLAERKMESKCPYIRECVGMSSGTVWVYNKHMQIKPGLIKLNMGVRTKAFHYNLAYS